MRFKHKSSGEILELDKKHPLYSDIFGSPSWENLTKEKKPVVEESKEQDISAMSVRQLRAYAKDNGLPIPRDAIKKADILKALQ